MPKKFFGNQKELSQINRHIKSETQDVLEEIHGEVDMNLWVNDSFEEMDQNDSEDLADSPESNTCSL